MQATKEFIERIESNWGSLANAVVEDLHGDPETPHYHSVPDPELVERARRLVHHLENWLWLAELAKVRSFYEPVGARRFAQQIPLAEVVRKIRLLERRVVALARSRKPNQTPHESKRETELLDATRAFFNEVINSITHGYHVAGMSKPG